jgi:hypothetical protein
MTRMQAMLAPALVLHAGLHWATSSTSTPLPPNYKPF